MSQTLVGRQEMSGSQLQLVEGSTRAEGRTQGPHAAGSVLSVPLGDNAARMLLVTHFVAWLDDGCQARISDLTRAGLTPELIDRLRGLSVADAMRLAARPCGLTISVDCTEMQAQLGRVERQRDERAQFERFVSAGASPSLVARLFGVSAVEVRRRRRLIAPHAAVGGRPRLPDEAERRDIQNCWADMLHRPEISERSRWLRLHESYPHIAMVSLEEVIERLQVERMRLAS